MSWCVAIVACGLLLLVNTSCILLSRLWISSVVTVVPVVVVWIFIVLNVSGASAIDTLVTDLTTVVALDLEPSSGIQCNLLTIFIVVTTLVHTFAA
jgi:hypothetical protein